MKLTQFDADVNRNITNARVSPAGDLNSFGASTKGQQALIGTLNAIGEDYKTRWMKDQNDRVIDATNDYMRQMNSLMNDEKNGLYLNHQGKNSESLQDAYHKGEEEIYQNIMKDHGLSSDYAVRAFNEKRNTLQTSELDTIDKYQRKQMDIYADNQAQELMDNTKNSLILDPSHARDTIYNMLPLLKANLAGRGYDESTVNLKTKNAMDTIVTGALESYAITNDYTAGLDMINLYSTLGGDAGTIKKFRDFFSGQKINSTTSNDYQNFLQSNNINCTTENFEENYAKFAKEHTLKASGISTGNADYDKWDDFFEEAMKTYNLTEEQVRNLKAMCMQESTFREDAYHDDKDGDPTLGPFQFKSATIEGLGYSAADRTDPKTSIMAAAKLYRQDLDAHNGNDELAILSHNGGVNGTEAARANGYLDAVKSQYQYLYGSGMSDEEREKLEAQRMKAAKSVWLQRKQEQTQQIANTYADARLALSQISDPYARETRLQAIMAANPLFANSSQAKSLMASIKGAQTENTSGGTVKNGMVKNMISIIGTGITSREDFDQKIQLAEEKGYHFSDAQRDMLEYAWDRYQKGDKEFSVEIPSAKELADYTGVDSSQFDETTRGLIRQRIYQYNNNQYQMIPNPNNYPATQDVVKRIAQEVVQNKLIYHDSHWFKEDEDYYVNMNGLARAGVTEYTPYGNGMFQVLGRNGESFWCTAAQLQDINDGKKTMLDVMQENS